MRPVIKPLPRPGHLFRELHTGRGLPQLCDGALSPWIPQGVLPAEESARPSPTPADPGFFGARPFSRTHALLTGRGARTVDWRLP